MSEYRKKPVVIEAIRWTGKNFEELTSLLGSLEEGEPKRIVVYGEDGSLKIYTLEGVMKVNVGDYIIKGVKSEVYPCKPDIFEQMYEEAVSQDDDRAVAACQNDMSRELLMPFRVRHASPYDENLILEWANDPVTRNNSFSSDLISKETHHKWFYNRLTDVDGCRIYIIETKYGIPIGQIRFERGEEGWIPGFVVSPLYRGKHLGKLIFNAGLQEFRKEYPGALVVGHAKSHNIPIHRILEGLEFIRVKSENGVITYQRELL